MAIFIHIIQSKLIVNLPFSVFHSLPYYSNINTTKTIIFD